MKSTKINPFTKKIPPILQFHHLGLAVRQPEASLKLLTAQGYRVGSEIFDPNQSVNAVLCQHETEPSVEVLWPGSTLSPIENLVNRHASGVVYHICYLTPDLGAALEKMNDLGLGVTCISPPQAAPLFAKCKVSFYNIRGLGLVEILENNLLKSQPN